MDLARRPQISPIVPIFFGLPQLGIRLSPIQAGLIGLSLHEGAIMAEITRSGLMSVGEGQREAAKSLGMSYFQSLRLVVLPQALRVILPPLGNEFNSMLRTTSLLSVISVEELLRQTSLRIAVTFRPVELYAVASVYYLAMTTTWNSIQAVLERRMGAGVESQEEQRHGFPTLVRERISRLRGVQ
jgi:polar amino acid transport system permease protein